MATDPICGMTVDESTALKAEWDGETFYFCCEHCRRKFLGETASAPLLQVLQPMDTGQRHTVTPPATADFYCPMCEGVESDQPGSCPRCGMALERARPAASGKKVIYTCPMHPDVEQDGPGTCPKCGMALEPK